MDQHGEGEAISAEAVRLNQVTNVVAAFISHNRLSQTELLELIASVNGAFVQLTAPASKPPPPSKEPAVPIKKSVTNDYIICLEDGKKFKSLRRHLMSTYKMTPAEYRAKWNLPVDYPMVAPSYSQARSALAKSIGLGQAAAKARRKATSPSAAVKSKPAKASAGKAVSRKKKS